MELHVSRNSKFFCLAMSFLMVLSLLISTGTVVYANESTSPEEFQKQLSMDIKNNRLPLLSEDQKQIEINKIAKELAFMFEKAPIKNSVGEVIEINFTRIESQFPEQINSNSYYLFKQFFENERSMHEIDSINGRGFTDCMGKSIKEYVGDTIYMSLTAGGLWALIQKKAWQEIAALVFEVAGAEFTIPVVVAALGLMSIKCLV